MYSLEWLYNVCLCLKVVMKYLDLVKAKILFLGLILELFDYFLRSKISKIRIGVSVEMAKKEC